MFHQVEGLVIDKGSHLGHLKWILEEFCKAFFEVDQVKMRFRPSFFPFTEPSLEVDIQCRRDKGEVRFGEGDDWLEILGCGMVHPNVLRNCGLDPDEYQGFAWGMGIDRIAMLKYGMPDLRAFFEADVRWLSHYGFRPLDFPTLAGGLSRDHSILRRRVLPACGGGLGRGPCRRREPVPTKYVRPTWQRDSKLRNRSRRDRYRCCRDADAALSGARCAKSIAWRSASDVRRRSGRYIVDFVSHAAKVVIEVDGEPARLRLADEARDAQTRRLASRRKDFECCGSSNDDVMTDTLKES